MNFLFNVLMGLVDILLILLVLFLVFKAFWEVYRRLKGLELQTYDEDKEIPLGIASRFFASSFFSKLSFQLISVKVWGLVAGTLISTWLACKNISTPMVIEGVGVKEVSRPILSGAQWTTFNTTIWALIFGMKEVFKVVDQRSKQDTKAAKELQEAQAQHNLKLEEAKAQRERVVLAQVQAANGGGAKVDSEGHELVGDDPEE